LFTVSEDWNRREKIGQAEITLAGSDGPNSSSTLSPAFGVGSAQMAVDMSKFLKFFLVCVQYYDETDTPYADQKFAFQLPDQLGNVNRLDEIASKNARCTPSP
jgi:hypothetical protein